LSYKGKDEVNGESTLYSNFEQRWKDWNLPLVIRRPRMNIPQTCNNPVNLMLSKSVGECVDIHKMNPKTGVGYCVFETPMAGWRAAHRQIETDQKRRLTLKQFIFKFAPPNENDTNEYLQFMCEEFKVDPDYPLSALSKFAVAGVMAQMEGYYNKEV
jgi:hypothetical protein